MKRIGKKWWYLLKNTTIEFVSDNGLTLSASLSYYTIFSLPPLLLIILSVLDLIFGHDAVKGNFFMQIKGLVGNDTSLQIQEMIKNARLSDSNAFVTAIGLILLLLGASAVFSEIQNSINIIWGIVARPKRGLVKFFKNRLMSFSMVGSVGFLLLVGLIVNTMMDIFSKQLVNYFPWIAIYGFYILNSIGVFLIITALFTILFRAMPDGKIPIKSSMIGAVFTSALFMLGKFIIGAYISSSHIASVYGTMGSVILILVWVYYSSIILYFGAEFTKIYTRMHGQKIIPNAYTIQVLKTENAIG